MVKTSSNTSHLLMEDDDDDDECEIPDDPKVDKCAYVKENCEEEGGEGLIKYLFMRYCSFDKVPAAYFVILVIFLILYFILMSSTAEHYFVPSLLFISDTIGLSESMAGITFLAIGNGAPDIFSQIAGAGGESFDITLGEAMGSGLFAIAIIVGLVGIIKPFEMSVACFYKDIPAYLLCGIFLIVTVAMGQFTLTFTILFPVLYILYVIFSGIWEYIENKRKKFRLSMENSTIQEKDKVEEETPLLRKDGDNTPVQNEETAIEDKEKKANEHSHHGGEHGEGEHIERDYSQYSTGKAIGLYVLDSLKEWMHWDHHGIFGRIMAIVELPFTLARVATTPHISESSWSRSVVNGICTPILCVALTGAWEMDLVEDKFPAWAMALIVSVIITPLTVLLDRPKFKRYTFVKACFALWVFGISIIWLNAIATELVSVLKTIGYFTKISEGVLSATVLSWGAAFEDTVANLAVARQGRPMAAVAACYAGPLVNSFIGMALSSMIFFVKNKSISPIPFKRGGNSFLVSGCIVLCLVLTFVVGLIRKRKIERWFAITLFVFYVLFTAFVIMIESKVFGDI